MRILICTNVYPPRFVGGAELVAHELAKQMLALGHQVAAFVGDLDGPGEHQAMGCETRDGVSVYRINTLQQDYDPQHLNFLHPVVDRHFAAVLQDFAPDVVHCHNLMGLSARLPILAAEYGARVFVTLHDFWGFCLRNTLLREGGHPCTDYDGCRACLPVSQDTAGGITPLRLRKDLLKLAFDHVDGLIAPSGFVARTYQDAGLGEGRIAVIPNGMDLQRFCPSPPAQKQGMRLLYVGYFGPHKGVDVLLQALALLERTDVRLELVGVGSEKAAYLERIAALGLADRIVWGGRVQPADMPAVYARADVVVLPSVWGENQPVCLMEAMACGLPVVASRIGGIPEMFDNGQEGLLFDAGDPRALADALEVLARSPGRRAAMGRKGRERLMESSYREQAGRLLDLFAGGHGHEDRRLGPPLIALQGDYRTRMKAWDRAQLDGGAASGSYVVPQSWLTDRLLAQAEQRYLLDDGTIWLKLFRLFAKFPLIGHISRKKAPGLVAKVLLDKPSGG